MTQSKDDARAARLKTALRENLRRRKTQARSRAADACSGDAREPATGGDGDLREPDPDLAKNGL